MAGSFSHCNAEDGSFRWSLIDNMGDAFEACHMMHFMIRHMAAGDDKMVNAAEEAYYSHVREHGYEPFEA